MGERSDTPWGGIGLALATGVIAMLAGANIPLMLVVMLLWVGSLYLVPMARQDAMVGDPSPSLTITRSEISRLIEQSALALLLLDRERIILANAAAREAVGAHVLGQDARVAFRHPAAIDLLDRPEGGETMVLGLTGPRSNWHMRRQKVDERYWLVELIDRSAEADVSRAHTDFVANASHELRTPLASIIGYVETLAEEGAGVDPGLAARFHETVLREARRLQSLVSDLMSLSKVQAEKHEVPRESVPLVPLVRRAAQDAASAHDSSRLQFDLGEDLSVRGAPEQLEQLFRNVVENALKYGDADKPVEIRVTSGRGNMAQVEVRDHGEGVAPEHLPHLTRRFYRTDPGRSRAAGGTGLGLAIVKHIVERHRGRLDIESTQGKGTTVQVRLPIAES